MELDGRLADPDPGVRARAVEALVERKGDQARDAVLDAVKDPDDDVRTRALYQALGAGVKLPDDVLTDLARSDPSPSVRFLALEALAADGPGTRAIVEAALDDPSPHIQRKAQELLRRLDAAPRSRRPSRPAQDR
jgi:HEAT repeat protein